MFKMPGTVTALLVAGMMGLACSSSGLKSRAGDAGAASGGQAGSAIISGTTGGSGGTSGPGGISTSATDGGAIGPGGAGGAKIGGIGGTASPGGAGTGGTGGTIIGPGGSGGASTGRTGGLASSATSSGGGGNTGGISSGGQANTGGSAGAGGMSSSGGANGTAGAAGSDSTQTSLDASVSADVSADVQVFSQCSLGIVFAGLVCSTGPWGSYSGKLIAAAPIDTGGDPEFSSCVSSTNGSLQYSFTLALGDGGTTRIGYGSESASALMPLPSLAAWVGKSVNVAVLPDVEGYYAGGGSSLTVTDSASLVLAVNTTWMLGGSLASQTVGSPETPGITVTPDAPICVGNCNQLEGGFVFSGTSAVSLAPGGVGSFQLGDMTFTAYAGLWHGGFVAGRLPCADASNSSSWAIFRNGI
jgi:hypothetical protein